MTAYGTRHVRVGGSLVDRVHEERILGGEPALRRERNPLSTPGRCAKWHNSSLHQGSEHTRANNRHGQVDRHHRRGASSRSPVK